MAAYPGGEMVPRLDLGDQPPNTMRPSSSPSRFTSLGSVAPRKRSVRAKPARSRHGANLRSHASGKADALPDSLVYAYGRRSADEGNVRLRASHRSNPVSKETGAYGME